jgi:hypothetical protein
VHWSALNAKGYDDHLTYTICIIHAVCVCIAKKEKAPHYSCEKEREVEREGETGEERGKEKGGRKR